MGEFECDQEGCSNTFHEYKGYYTTDPQGGFQFCSADCMVAYWTEMIRRRDET